MIVTDLSAPTYPAWLPARVGSSAPVAEQPASSTTASMISGATTDRQLALGRAVAVGSAQAPATNFLLPLAAISAAAGSE